jgi:ubiquitin-protein ligase
VQIDMPLFLSFFTKKKCLVDDPLVGSIAQEYLTNKEEHDKTAREWTKT